MSSADVAQAVTKVGWDGCDVAHELGRDLLGAEQLPERHDSHESRLLAQLRNSCLPLRSLVRDLSPVPFLPSLCTPT